MAKQKTTVATLLKNHVDVEAAVTVIVQDGDGIEAFVSALQMVADHYGATLNVGVGAELTDTSVEPEEEPEDEEDLEEPGEDEPWTEELLDQYNSDELREVLDNEGLELEGRFGRNKAIAAILENQ